MTNLIPEYLSELDQEVLKCAEEVGLDEEKAKHLSKLVSKCLTNRWRGLSIYFRSNKREIATEKHDEILGEYNGRNTRFLAQKYGLSQQWIYKIIEKHNEKNKPESDSDAPVYKQTSLLPDA